jgi:ABC-type bacteriocin/lantibiotic exporter with double-glycine peptidase domain
MHDFPPVVPDFTAGSRLDQSPRRRSSTRDFADPDTRSGARLLLWTVRQQTPLILLVSLMSLVQMLPASLGPYLVGRVVDDGIIARDMSAVVDWCLALLGIVVLGVAGGILGHTLIVRMWLVVLYAIIKLVTRKTTQMGHIQPQRMPTGEILSVSSGDSDQFGALTEVLSRAIGAGLAYLMVAAIILNTSLELGIVVLVAAPVLVLVALPLLRPLGRRQAVERSTSSELTSMATDIVAGLRILRGIGGERTFARNYAAQSQVVRKAGLAAGTWQAAVDATGVLFAGLFLVAITWLGARLVAVGELSVGQLISFFGYAVFMIFPVRTFFELAQKTVRCLVSARKTAAVLGQQPPWRHPAEPLSLPLGEPIRDLQTGFVGEAGLLTVVVSAVPDDSAALADRLGRYLPTETDPISLDIDESIKGRRARQERARQAEARVRLAARDQAITDRQWGVEVGRVDLADCPIDDVRRHIVVSDTSGAVFAGTLQAAVDPHGRLTREQAERAMHTAAAEDVFEAMPGGWQGHIDERGRGLSGGQRQRLVLARVLALDPEILVLVEPTSAVDAHTEALIAERLAEHRRGRTTIVMSGSPLLLHHADRVALMGSGRVLDQGTHDELLERSPEYRHVVVRTMEEAVDV